MRLPTGATSGRAAVSQSAMARKLALGRGSAATRAARPLSTVCSS